jgi:hypothetical protein
MAENHAVVSRASGTSLASAALSLPRCPLSNLEQVNKTGEPLRVVCYLTIFSRRGGRSTNTAGYCYTGIEQCSIEGWRTLLVPEGGRLVVSGTTWEMNATRLRIHDTCCDEGCCHSTAALDRTQGELLIHKIMYFLDNLPTGISEPKL